MGAWFPGGRACNCSRQDLTMSFLWEERRGDARRMFRASSTGVSSLIEGSKAPFLKFLRWRLLKFWGRKKWEAIFKLVVSFHTYTSECT